MPEIIVKLGDNIVQKYFFFQEPLTVGRAPDNEIVIENLAISRNHATIKFEDGHYYVNDLNSSNGTFVNGVKIKKTEIMDKDVITVGKHKLYFYDQRTTEVVRQPTLQDNDSTMLFTAAPEVTAALEVCKGRQKGQKYNLNSSGMTSIGRGNDNDIRMTDWFVSKQHAQIEQREQKFILKDLGSWRHTFVNGETIQETVLNNGDLIQLGPTVEMRFVLAGEEAAKPNARVPQNLPLSHDEQIPEKKPGPDRTAQHDVDDVLDGMNGNGAQPHLAAFAAEEPRDETSSLPIEQLNLGSFGEPEPAPAQEPENSFEQTPAEPIEFGTGEMPADAFAPMDPSQAQVEQEAQASPLLAPARPEADHAEAVYEDLAEQSLLAAAGAAAPVPVAEPESNPEPQPEKAAGEGETEIEMWERALQNKSAVIRKQAARRLKQLTGKDYEY